MPFHVELEQPPLSALQQVVLHDVHLQFFLDFLVEAIALPLLQLQVGITGPVPVLYGGIASLEAQIAANQNVEVIDWVKFIMQNPVGLNLFVLYQPRQMKEIFILQFVKLFEDGLPFQQLYESLIVLIRAEAILPVNDSAESNLLQNVEKRLSYQSLDLVLLAIRQELHELLVDYLRILFLYRFCPMPLLLLPARIVLLGFWHRIQVEKIDF